MRTKQVLLPQIHKPKNESIIGWYVYFSVYDEYTGKMKRFRRFDGFNECTTYKECSVLASKIKSRYTKKLKLGWTPFFSDDVIWSDNLLYNDHKKKQKKTRRTKRTIAYYSSQYLELHCKKLSKGTYDKRRSELRIFKKWLVKKKLDNIDVSEFTEENAQDFFKYLDDKGRTGNTKNGYLLTIKSVWAIITKKYKFIADPFENVAKYKKSTIPQRPLKRGIVSVLKNELEKTDPQLWLAAQFMYYCFIRPKEMRFMKLINIDFFDGRITLESTITKANKTRIVEISDEFLSILINDYKLNTYPEGYYIFTIKGLPGEKPVGKNYFWSRFDSVRKTIKKTKDYKFYGFKHTGAVAALSAGANIKDIQHQMGHSSIDITDEYLKSMVGYESEFFKRQMPAI